MTFDETMPKSGSVINQCVHCANYCVFELDDIRHILEAGKRPQILCHHCQKLFSPGPDVSNSDKGEDSDADKLDSKQHSLSAAANDQKSNQSDQSDPQFAQPISWIWKSRFITQINRRSNL